MKLHGFKLALSSARRASPSNQGFTLVELLIAIAVLGILAAIAIPSLLNLVNQTKINLLAEQIRQSLKQAQQQAISEEQSYSVTFRQMPQGLQVKYSPADSQPELQGIKSSNPPLAKSPVRSKAGTWQNLSSSIPLDQLIFSVTDLPNNTITFTPEGDIEYPTKVFLALGNQAEPRVNTRRCINVTNSESGGSYFQIDKDLACDLSPNASPYTDVVR